MSKALALTQEFNQDQLSLIKSTIAKGATTDELKLFLYRCQELGLDPLKPGQIYFIKYGNSPGTIVVGIDGFRARAQRTGQYGGIKRGVTKDENGKLLTAWCEIYRKDWKEPAREEVSLAEYNTQKGMWLKMPEQMLKKVAEACALRMAFPDELGGVYSTEEMDQAARGNPDHRMAVTAAKDAHQPTLDEPDDFATGKREVVETSALADAGEYVITFGELKGVKLKQCSPDELISFMEKITQTSIEKGQEIRPNGPVGKAFTNIEAYLAELELAQ